MSDPLDEETREIVDLDSCSKKKSILIGAVVTCALSLFAIVPLLNVVVGAVLAVGLFTKTHAISIRKRVGAKIGALSVALGSALFFPMSGGVWMIVRLTDPEFAAEEKERQIRALYEQGSASMAQFFEEYFPTQIEQSQLTIILVFMFFFVVAFAAVFGAIFGAIGAAIFKKGPLAL